MLVQEYTQSAKLLKATTKYRGDLKEGEGSRCKHALYYGKKVAFVEIDKKTTPNNLFR